MLYRPIFQVRWSIYHTCRATKCQGYGSWCFVWMCCETQNSTNFRMSFTVLNSWTRRTNLGRAVEHNRQSGLDLCYCQFHGLKVQLSDTDQCLTIGLPVHEIGQCLTIGLSLPKIFYGSKWRNIHVSGEWPRVHKNSCTGAITCDKEKAC